MLDILPAVRLQTGNRFSYVGKLSDLSLQPGGPLPADVLIINAQYFTFSSAISAAAIQAFVRAGGGIIVAAMTSDYDDQATFYNYLLNHPANKITLPMGAAARCGCPAVPNDPAPLRVHACVKSKVPSTYLCLYVCRRRRRLVDDIS